MGQGSSSSSSTQQRQQAKNNIKITDQDRSILNLKLQRDKLKQYQKRIQVVLNREREIAVQSLSQGNKSRALTALRQRKYQESLLVQTDRQLETLQNLVSSIEFSLVEKDILYGLQQGNAVLKEIHKEMNLEMVERLMSDTIEGIAYQKEVSELLSTKMSADEEDEVQEELAALVSEELKRSLPQVPTHSLPDLVPEEAQEEEEELESIAPTRQREAMYAA